MKLIELIGFLCFIIALVILWQFRQILLLVFTAVVVTVVLNRIVRWMMNVLEIPRSRAVPLALVAVLTLFALFIGLVFPPFIRQFQELLLLIPEGFESLINWGNNLIRNPPSWFPPIDSSFFPQYPDLLRQAGNLARNIFGNFFNFFSSSLAVVLQVLLVFVLMLMVLSSPHDYRSLLIRLFPSFYRQRADDIFDRCENTLIHWIQGVSMSSLFVATLSGIGLLILGVPLVLAHALLAGVFNFVPNIGPTLSAVFPVAVALLESPGKAIAVIVLYIIIQNLESYWFSPMVMQKQVSLLPAITLITQIFFATFLGPLGLILALPLAVVAKIWIEEAFVKDVLDQWSSKRGSARQLAPVLQVEEVITTPDPTTDDKPALPESPPKPGRPSDETF